MSAAEMSAAEIATQLATEMSAAEIAGGARSQRSGRSAAAGGQAACTRSPLIMTEAKATGRPPASASSAPSGGSSCGSGRPRLKRCASSLQLSTVTRWHTCHSREVVVNGCGGGDGAMVVMVAVVVMVVALVVVAAAAAEAAVATAAAARLAVVLEGGLGAERRQREGGSEAPAVLKDPAPVGTRSERAG